MAESSAVIVGGGGVAALPAFTPTDETQGRGVFITQDDPASIGSARFGQDPATGMTWINGGLTDAQIAASARGPVTLGLGLVNLAAIAAASRPVLIGQAAGVGNLTGDLVAIGVNTRAGGNSVALGAGTVVTALAGTSANVAINSTGLTHGTANGLVAIACGGSAIAGQLGTFIQAQNPVSTGGGIGIGGSGNPNISAFGVGIGTGSVLVTGDRCIALGDATRAGAPTTATDYRRCIAIGTNAVADGSGGGGNVGSIAIGDQASATGTTLAASMALGVSAVAVAGEAVYGSATRPFTHRFFSEAVAGEGLRVDANATADNVRILVWDVTAAALVRVSRGAVDSGGAGFRLLRVPN